MNTNSCSTFQRHLISLPSQLVKMDKVQKKIQELSDKINHYNTKYYQESISEITDFEFDTLLKELQEHEEKHPEYKLPDSPTQRVGGTITKDFETVTHKFRMLSLDNSYNEEELRDFDKRVIKSIGEDYEYICELKFDGVAISLTYENGVLIQGATRGDGKQGDNITNNARTIRTIPLRVKTDGLPDTFEVRGEVFMPNDAFEKLNKEKEENGEPTLANPRNTASGTLKMQDSAIVASRNLDCYIYSLQSGDDIFESQEENFKMLKNLGFKVSEGWEKCNSIDEVLKFIKKWEKKRFDLPLATDGIVIKINSINQQNDLGNTTKSPRWAIAYKYKAESSSTKLESIEYQVGRTGSITPVANLAAVQLSGTTVKRASLHNADIIEKLDLHLDDTVFVEKGGEIIPKITGVDVNKRDIFAQKVNFISECPACKTELIRTEGEANHFCPNTKGCKPQIIGRVEHFIQRKALNIDSLGSETIEQLYDNELIVTPADLYELHYEDLIKLERFAEKSVQNLLKGVELSKKTPFESVLYGLGIRFVGNTVAEKLAMQFKNMNGLKNATFEQLIETPEIGERIAISVQDWFKEEDNLAIIEKLLWNGLNFEISEDKLPVSEKLKGLSIVVSGVFQNYGRDELKEIIKKNGGKVSSSISSKTDYLVAGDKMGPAKRTKAEGLEVKIISEEEFGTLI